MTEIKNPRILWTISVMLIVVFFCPFTYGNVIYVDNDAAGANDGSNWENAYTYLQEALAYANTADKPVEIRVAQGIYRPNEGLEAIPEFDWRTITFQLINDVTLMGGYAGIGGADPNERNLQEFKTILSGDLNGDDGLNFTGNSENCYHVVTGSGTDNTAVLDGFVVTGGNANDPTRKRYFNGGGLYNIDGSVSIRNCIFTRNTADTGGGLYCENEAGGVSRPVLENCTFVANSADRFGGALVIAADEGFTSPIISRCEFIQNVANTGGAVWADSLDFEPVTWRDCTFIENSAMNRGAPSISIHVI